MGFLMMLSYVRSLFGVFLFYATLQGLVHETERWYFSAFMQIGIPDSHIRGQVMAKIDDNTKVYCKATLGTRDIKLSYGAQRVISEDNQVG